MRDSRNISENLVRGGSGLRRHSVGLSKEMKKKNEKKMLSPKREKCSINSFSRALRGNTDDLSMICAAASNSIQTIALEENPSVFISRF